MTAFKQYVENLKAHVNINSDILVKQVRAGKRPHFDISSDVELVAAFSELMPIQTTATPNFRSNAIRRIATIYRSKEFGITTIFYNDKTGEVFAVARCDGGEVWFSTYQGTEPAAFVLKLQAALGFSGYLKLL